jgi:hypothetical protein
MAIAAGLWSYPPWPWNVSLLWLVKKVQSEIVLCATFFKKNASLSNAIFVFVYWDRTTNPKTRILRPV